MSNDNKGNEPRVIASDVSVWCSHDKLIDVVELIPNPRNPNKHPDKQIALLGKIIRAQGWRQNITVSNRSGFIVKGHGRLQAAKLMGVELVPVEFQDYANEAEEYADLMADNRIAELAEADSQMIIDLMNDSIFTDFDMDLTGFDSGASEMLGSINSGDENDEWVGMPEFDPIDNPLKLIISFKNEEDRTAFDLEYGIKVLKKQANAWSTWFPYKEPEDLASLEFSS